MRTPAWEDGDLLYRPTPYELDGTYRVQADGDQTLLSWARPTPWFTVGEDGALVGKTGDGLAKFHHLRDLIEEHDWTWLSLGSSTLSPQQRAWVDGVWRPWSRRWHELESSGRLFEMDFSVSEATLREIAGGLSSRREEAAAHGLPVPDIGSGRLGFLRDRWDSQRDPAYQAALRRVSTSPTLTSGAISGAIPGTIPGTIEDFRREARRALDTPGEVGPEDDDARVIGVLFWHGKRWVTPFRNLGRARAYFDHARGIGIDFDYGAYFDVSDPQRPPVLAWERFGQSPTQTAGSPGRVPAHTDLRYHAADAGAPMNIPLIGRHGGGGGAHASHPSPATHGHGHPGHPDHGRRFFGGWGWGGWDDGAYGDPYASPYPWWIYGGEPSGVSVDEEEFEVTSGDYLRAPPRRSLLSARDDLRGAADVLSPGVNGLHCELNLGSDMVLRASICVDGQCYQGAADLSRLLHDIHARLHGADVTEEVIGRSGRRRRHHRRHRRHRQEQQEQQEQEQEGQEGQGQGQGFPGQGFPGYPPAPYPPYPYPYPPQPYPQPVASVAPAVAPVVVTPTVAALPAAAPVHTRDHRHRDAQADAATVQTQQAVQTSGELLIGALYNQHCAEVAAGWFDSIKDTFSNVWHAAATTLQKFKGPITAAAQQYAQQYGGETGGQLAGQLAGSVIDAAAGSGDKKQQAQQVVAIAAQAAQTQPKIAAALSAAQTAAAQTTAAYHVTSTALDALRGNPEAMQKLDQLRADAASGDPAARRALDLVTLALQAMRSPGPGADGGNNNGDQVGGLLPWLGLAALGGGAYWWWSHHQRARERARQAARQAAAEAAAEHAGPPPSPQPTPSPRGSSTTTSGEIGLAKADAVAAVQAAWNLNQANHYFGFVKQRASSTPSTIHGHNIVLMDTTEVLPFQTAGDLWGWYRQTTSDPHGYEFIALFDASSPQWPNPILAQEPNPNEKLATADGAGPDGFLRFSPGHAEQSVDYPGGHGWLTHGPDGNYSNVHPY